MKSHRNDFFTEYFNIPVSFVKPVSEHLASLLTYFINNFIKELKFPDQ